MKAILLAALVLAAGCSTATQQRIAADEQRLITFTAADLSMAIAMAGNATDPGAPYRARCYTTLLKHLADFTPGSGPTPIGVVSTFEKAAELDARLAGGTTTGISADVHADCAGLITGTQEFILRMGLKFGH